jgi:cytochrome c biogenesis DsbD-like protein
MFLFLLAIPVCGLEIRVVESETGQPMEAVMVIFPGNTNKTDASGRSAGSGSKVMVHKSGYVPMEMSWKAGSEPPRFEFRLLPAQTIGGRVVDASANTVSGAAITVIVPGRLTEPRFAVEDFPVTSDTQGRWRCDFVPKDPAYVRLEFSHPNFEWPEKEFSLDELLALKAELKVTPVLTLFGRVLGSSGEPVPRAKVILGNEYSVHDEPETLTDSDGKFAFHRQRPQRRLIGVHAEGWAPTLQSFGTNSTIEIRLQKGTPLRVRVEDASGQPLPGVDANLTELEGTNGGRWSYPLGYWHTGAQGTFVWTNTPDQPCAWYFSRSGYMGRDHLQLRPTSNEAVVRLGLAFSLTGTVVDATNGRPISEFTLNARYVQSGSPGTWYEWGRKIFRTGKFNVYYEEPLLGGSTEMHDWQFRVEADGYEPALSRVIRDEERGTNIAFQLTRRAPPQINVPAPSAKARVTAAIAVQPSTVAPGETLTIFIKARVAEGHWIYALENSGSETIPTGIEASVPSALKAEGPWRSPAPKTQADESRTLAGELLFARPYLIESRTQPQKHKLRFKLKFQVCNELVCWPPESVDIETEVEIVRARL